MTTATAFNSVAQAFDSCAARFADNDFLRAPPDNTADGQGVTLSYAQTQARVQRLIPAYIARGVRRGDRIALVFDSRKRPKR